MLVRQLDLSNWQQQVFRPHHCPTHLNSTLVKLFSRTSLQIMSLSQKNLSVNKIIHSIQIQYIFIHWIMIWILFSIVDILVKPMQLKSFLRYILCAFDRGCYWHLELKTSPFGLAAMTCYYKMSLSTFHVNLTAVEWMREWTFLSQPSLAVFLKT